VRSGCLGGFVAWPGGLQAAWMLVLETEGDSSSLCMTMCGTVNQHFDLEDNDAGQP
jgi:hypothetical protein